MRVSQIGRDFADGTSEPMRGGEVAKWFDAYLLELVRGRRSGAPVAALKARDARGQLTIYRRKAA